MCDQDIYIAMLDKQTGALVQYKSSDKVDPVSLNKLQHNKDIIHEKYDNGDYEHLKGKFTTKEQLSAM